MKEEIRAKADAYSVADEKYMAMALELAKKGAGRTSPNPMVGAVIVKDGRVIGSGFHERCGQPHAERNALASCTEDPAGATLYATLEPCCHYGKQPPCTEAILQAGIARVVVGSPDPNPLVAGKGVRILREGGVAVTEGVLQDECDRLNRIFFHYITTGTPFVMMKYAVTLDGKIAAHSGHSRWVTGEAARRHVHEQRNLFAGIMVGVGTVLTDDPLLTCRIEGGENPVRIVCDSALRTPLSSKLVSTAAQMPVIIATCCGDKQKQRPYLAAGCRIIEAAGKDGRVDLPALMKILGEDGIDGVLLEGGGTLNWSALASGIVCGVQAYIAPKLVGGSEAKTPVGGEGFSLMSEALELKNVSLTRLGEDFLIEGEVK